MNKIIMGLFLICFISAGFATLTSNKIAWIDESTNRTIIWDPVLNTSTAVQFDYMPVSIKRARDGTSDFVITAKKSVNNNTIEQIADNKVYLVSEDGDIKFTFANTNYLLGCVKTIDAYYCGHVGENTDYIYKFSTAGVLLDSESVGATSGALHYYDLDFDPVNSVIYKVRDPADAGSQMKVYTYSESGGVYTTIGYTLSPTTTYFITYDSLIDRIGLGQPTYINYYGFFANRTMNYTINSTYTRIYGGEPFVSSTGSLITFSNITGLVYEYDGVNLRTYPANISYGNAFAKQILYTELYSQGLSGNYEVEIRTSGGVPGCYDSEAIPATCTFTGQSYGNVYYITSSTDNSASDEFIIQAGVKGLTMDYIALGEAAAQEYGVMRPYAIWWDIDQQGVGGTGLSTLQAVRTTNDIGQEGFRLVLKTRQSYFTNYGGLISHWYKQADGYPAILAGKYAAPLIIAMSPEYELDPTAITWDYSVSLPDPASSFNDYDNARLWRTFHHALAYNSTHYYVSNITWDAYGNINRTTAFEDWDTLNETLQTFGLTEANIAEIYADYDFSTPFEYSAASGKAILKGYVWGDLNQTIDNLGTDAYMDHPNPPASYNATYIKCDSVLAFQEEYNNKQGFCELRDNALLNNQARLIRINTPGIEIFPTITANVSYDNYYSGTDSFIADVYDYSCNSPNSTSTITGEILIQGDTILPVQFDNLTTRNFLGYILQVYNSQNQAQALVSVSTQYATQITNSSGEVRFYSITPNEFLNVSLKFLSKIVNYTGGAALQIGDYYNSQRYSDSGSCAAFDGYYRYQLALNPTYKTKQFTLTCKGVVYVPDALIYIDDNLKNTTDENGQAYVSMFEDYNLAGYNISFVSAYGNKSVIMRDLRLDNYTFMLTECDETGLLAVSTPSAFNLEDFLNKLASPLIIGFIIFLGLAAVVWLKTGSIELTGIAFIGFLIIGYYLALVPLFVVIALIAIMAFALASKTLGWLG